MKKRSMQLRARSGESEKARDEDLDELFQRGFRYALALSHDPDRAADLLQDACVSCLRAGAAWRTGYLFSAIRSRFVDQYRRQMISVVEPIGDPGALERAGAAEDPTHDELFRADLDHLDRALGGLRADEREALYLSAVEGYSAREIAEATGRPRGTVLSVIHRARRKLRDRLRDSGIEETL